MIVLDPSIKVNTAGLSTFARRVQRLAGVAGQVEVLITGNRRIRVLNRRFRKQDKPTDVLSFPRHDGGDIAISADLAAANAVRYGHAASDELKILILHGMLHLAGYDHERDNGEMAAREAALRRQFGLPGSLIARNQPRRRLQ
ncbi:MAG TPA: rRNA maturation RNase YbeY [Candidatus Angelobacter sp.]